MKYPIGIQSFERIITEGYVYVDKTDLIYKLVNEGAVYFLSRPRRFGKSLLIDTLDCYLSGRKELFDGLAISKLEKDWKKHPVFRVDFNGGDFTIPGKLEDKIQGYINTWESLYGKDTNKLTIEDRFIGVLKRAYEQTGNKCVVLIDEYDKPLLDVLDTEVKEDKDNKGLKSLEEKHRNTLKAFYSTFKAADNYLKFVMLTGVTKFSQISVFSGFNQPNDISMAEKYEGLCGITQDELTFYFEEPIKAMSVKYKQDYQGMLSLLKSQYNGYHFGPGLLDVFNPFSLLNALNAEFIDNYWFATGSPSYLIRLMNHFTEQIDEMLSKDYFKSDFIDYKADVEMPLPMLFQSGYLTIRAFNFETGQYRLDFPNNEVRSGFLSLVASNYLDIKKGESPGGWAINAYFMLKRGDLEDFCKSLISFIASIPYEARESYNTAESSEKHFQYLFYLLMRLVSSPSMKPWAEYSQNVGRVDCLVETPEYVYIFEFKLDGSADAALQQIQDRKYALPYLDDKRKVYLIGMNFSSETRNIEEWKIIDI